jgi:hypothetical protein
MRPYRCYFLNAYGAIVGIQMVVCQDDSEAVELTPQLLARHPEHYGVEVWERSRLITLQSATSH